MEGIINWIANWFASHCDGDWEHENILRIEATSNPGWFITIGLSDTDMENVEFNMNTIESSENDWYFYKVHNGEFTAAGDLNKLPFLLGKFRELVESNVKH